MIPSKEEFASVAERARVAKLVEAASSLSNRVDRARRSKDADPENAELYAVAASHAQKACDALLKMSGNIQDKWRSRKAK